MKRIFRLHGDFPDGQLLLRSLKGQEQVSGLFEFTLEILSETPALDIKNLLGEALAVEVEQQSSSHFINGIVTRLRRTGRDSYPPKYYVYEATLSPWLWYATQTSDYRIFQDKSIKDILSEVLGEYGFALDLRLVEHYRKWTYCVQYDETDFDFVSRLMEHEGIYYWFEHDQGRHTLVLADDMSAHRPAPGLSRLPYYSRHHLVNPLQEYVEVWQPRVCLTPTAYAATDYDLNKPQARLDVRQLAQGKAGHSLNLEQYDPMGGYTEPEEGAHYARVRMQALEMKRHTIAATSNARALSAGHTFVLKNHPDKAQNREYLIVRSHYEFIEAPYHSAASTGQAPVNQHATLLTTIEAIPANVQYRHPARTPEPRTSGPQTARVVGPAGESIWTDKYGRIKVQFHWDRYGSKNERSSCWIRVSSPWAGGGFGGLQIPRVNEEVIVDFVGGHPDRPLVVGRVYNAENMPPVTLPEQATQSGFHTRTKDGSPDAANTVMFDDSQGSEMLKMVAQKDMQSRVKNNANHRVGGMSATNIAGAHTWNYGGLFNKQVAQAATYQHESGHRFSVAADATDSVAQRQKREYTGANTLSVGGAETLTVAGEPALHAFNQGVQSTLNAHRTDNITGSVVRNFDSGEDVTVSGLFSKSVGAGDAIMKADSFKVDAGGPFKLNCAATWEAYALSDILMKSGSLIKESTLMQSVNPSTLHEQNIKVAIGVNGINSRASKSADTSVAVKLAAGGMYDAMQLSTVSLVGAQVKLVGNSNSIDLVSIGLIGANMSLGKTDRKYVFRIEI